MVAKDPNNPGACHYYIHAVEASRRRARRGRADRLAQLMPGAGHIVHMPGHIYMRVGRYADATEANTKAMAVDEAYIQKWNIQGPYAEVGLRAQPVDAGVCPEMDKDDLSAQGRCRQARRIEPRVCTVKRCEPGLIGCWAAAKPVKKCDRFTRGYRRARQFYVSHKACDRRADRNDKDRGE